MQSSPFVPSGLSLLISLIYLLVRKYSVSSKTCEMHCRPEFMKQVLPKFRSPTTPCLEFSQLISSFSYYSDSALLGHRPSWKLRSFILHCLLQYATYLQLHKNSSFSIARQLEQDDIRTLLRLKKHQSVFYSLNSIINRESSKKS